MLEIRITDPQSMEPAAILKIVSSLLGFIGKDITIEHKAVQIKNINSGEELRKAVIDAQLAKNVAAQSTPPILHANHAHNEPTEASNNPFANYKSPPPMVPTHNPFKPTPPLAVIDIIEEELIPVGPESVGLPNPTEPDANGLPWDGRIHSREKTKNKDGTWRYMRRIADDKIKQVESELRQALGAPGVTAVLPIAPIKVTSPRQAVPPPPPPPSTNDFPALMRKITQAVGANKLHQTQVNQVLQEFQIPSIPALGARLDLIPAVSARIDELVGAAA